jgi:hypothetical protein
MQMQKSQKDLEVAATAQLLPKLSALRTTTRAAYASASPDLYALTTPMGSRCAKMLKQIHSEASMMLIANIKVSKRFELSKSSQAHMLQLSAARCISLGVLMLFRS